MRSGNKIGIIIVMILAMSVMVVVGFKGPKLELTTEGGVYPTECYIKRGADGQMIFRDAVTSKTLSELVGGVTDHGALTGLGDDDHLQYYEKWRLAEQLGMEDDTYIDNVGWDWFKHITIFDVWGERKLGDHLQDASIHWLRPARVVTVAKDGTGMYASIQEAIDSITDSGPTKPYVVMVYPGVYEITTVTLVSNLSYVAIVGVDRESCILKGDMGGATTNEHTLMNIQHSSDHITVANLTFHNIHNWNSTYQVGRCLLIQASDTYVYNCKFISNAKDALGITGNSADNVTIDTCYAEAYYFAMDMVNDPSASGWSNILIKDSVFKITIDDDADNHTVIYLPDAFERVVFQNCLFEAVESSRPVFGGHQEGLDSSTLYLYNCQSYGVDYGFSIGDVMTVKFAGSGLTGITTLEHPLHTGTITYDDIGQLYTREFGGVDVSGDVDITGNMTLSRTLTGNGSVTYTLGNNEYWTIYEEGPGESYQRVKFTKDGDLYFYDTSGNERANINCDSGKFTSKGDIELKDSGNNIMFGTNGDLNKFGSRWDMELWDSAYNVTFNVDSGTGKLTSKGDIELRDADDNVVFSADSETGDLTIERDLRCEDVTSSGSVTVEGNLAVDTNTLFVDSANNRVGIGLTTPQKIFEIRRDQNAATEMWISNSNTGSSARCILGFSNGTIRKAGYSWKPVTNELFLFNDVNGGGGIIFQTKTSGGTARQVTIDTNGAFSTPDGNTLGNGGDLTTVKDALRLNPVSSWSGTDEGTIYYDSDEDRIFVYSDIGGMLDWEKIAYKSDVVCPQLYVYGADYPTTRVLWHKADLLAGCIGQENEDVDKVEVSGAGFCKYAFVIAEKQDETAYFKDIRLKVGDARLRPCRIVGGRREGGYLVLEKGDRCLVEFPKEQVANADSVTLQVTGYYEIGKDASGLHKALSRMAKKISVESRMLRAETKDDTEAVNGEIYWTPDGELHAKRWDGQIFKIPLMPCE